MHPVCIALRVCCEVYLLASPARLTSAGAVAAICAPPCPVVSLVAGLAYSAGNGSLGGKV